MRSVTIVTLVVSAMCLLATTAAPQRASRSAHSLPGVFKERVPEERFEWQAVGQFPSGAWSDIRVLTRPRNQPIPSCTVVVTTNANGQPTQALQFANAVASSCGIYRPIAPTRQHRTSARVRIDQWSDGTVAGDWPFALGTFTRRGNQDFNAGPQVVVYVSTVDRDWRFYSIRADGGLEFIFPLGAPAELGVWYAISLRFDEDTGQGRVVITNAGTGALVVDQTVTVPFWSPTSSGGFENVGFFDGQYFSDATIGCQATIDNVSFFPFL